uniref:Uncharacterized protein n=1 Tax=Moniliophthora roreri TaxID=221103 RepID=A0A0W0FT96_MONRR
MEAGAEYTLLEFGAEHGMDVTSEAMRAVTGILRVLLLMP